MSEHILEDNLRPESDVSPHDFRLSFHELSAFEEALFVGFRDEPSLPSRSGRSRRRNLARHRHQ